MVGITPPSEQSPTTASCFTWFRNTGGNGCSQKALRSCAIPTVQPAQPVTPSGRGDVTDAPSEEEILRSETFLLAIPFRTDDNPDTRMQHPMARPSFSNLLRARSRCPQATPSTTARFRTALSRTSLSRSVTSSYSPNFAESPRWHSPRCIVSRYAFGTPGLGGLVSDGRILANVLLGPSSCVFLGRLLAWSRVAVLARGVLPVLRAFRLSVFCGELFVAFLVLPAVSNTS